MTVLVVSPEPSAEDAAVIAAVLELTRPTVTVAIEGPFATPTWRFSGRWWSRPTAVRRDRPWL
jgi:hypothetical protein